MYTHAHTQTHTHTHKIHFIHTSNKESSLAVFFIIAGNSTLNPMPTINCTEYKALILYSYGKMLVSNEKEWTADNCNDFPVN